MGLFVDALKRLYQDKKIDMKKIVELFESGKITKEERDYILDTH